MIEVHAVISGGGIFLPFALGALTLVGLVVFTLAKLAPWETPGEPPIHPQAHRREALAVGATQSLPATVTPTGAGEAIDLFVFSVKAGGKIVVEIAGAAVVAGVWPGTSPVKGQGLLRVCGLAWGCRVIPSAVCCLQVTNVNPADQTPLGPFSITVRPWSFWTGDYFKMYLHKSSC